MLVTVRLQGGAVAIRACESFQAVRSPRLFLTPGGGAVFQGAMDRLLGRLLDQWSV